MATTQEIRNYVTRMQQLQEQLATEILPRLAEVCGANRLLDIPTMRMANLILGDLTDLRGAIQHAMMETGCTSVPPTFTEILEWLAKHETQIGQFTRLTAEDERLDSFLKPYQKKVYDLERGTIQDPAFVEAALIFIEFAEKGCDFTNPAVVQKATQLETQFDRMVCLNLYTGKYHLKQGKQEKQGEEDPVPRPTDTSATPSVTLRSARSALSRPATAETPVYPTAPTAPILGKSATPAVPAKPVTATPVPTPASPAPTQLTQLTKPTGSDAADKEEGDRRPLRPIEGSVAYGVLEQTGTGVTEFSGKEFGDTANRNQPAKRILTILAKYYVLSYEQLMAFLGIDARKMGGQLETLIGKGYVNRYRYKTFEDGYQYIFSIGEICTRSSPRHIVAQYINRKFNKYSSAAILHAATSNLAAVLAGTKRSAFLRLVEEDNREVDIRYPDDGLNFGGIVATGVNRLWFFAPFFDEQVATYQAAELKRILLEVPSYNQIALYARTEDEIGDWNLALSNAKVPLQQINYFLENGTMLTHGFEPTGLPTLLFGDRPQAPKTPPSPEPAAEKSVPYSTDSAVGDKADKGEPPPDRENPQEEAPAPVENASLKEEVPKEETLKEESLKEEAPKEEMPKEETSKEEALKEEALKEEALKEEMPKEETSKEEALKEEALKEEAMKEREPKKEERKEEPSIEETDSAVKTPRAPIDLTQLPPLPVRNNRIGPGNGIFKGIRYPDVEDASGGVNTALTLVERGTAASALLYTRSLVRCDAAAWEPVYKMLAYAYNDPLANCTYNFVGLQSVYDNGVCGCSTETVLRFKLCAYLRMLFTDAIDMSSLHLLKADIIEHTFETCTLFQNAPAFPDLLREICGFIQQFQQGFGSGAASQIQGIDAIRNQKAAAQKRAVELLDIRLEESAAQFRRVKVLREKLFSRNGVMKDLVRPVAEGKTNGLEKGLHFCQRFQKVRAGETVFDEQKLNAYIDQLWSETSHLSARRKNEPLLNAQKIPIRNNMESYMRVFLEWEKLSKINVHDNNTFLIVCNRLLSLLAQVEESIAAVTTEPVGEAAGRRAVVDAMHDIQAILRGSRSGRTFYIDFLTSHQVELDATTTLPVLDESVSIIPGYELWNRVLAHEKEKIPFDDYLAQVMQGDGPREYDFGRQLALFRALRASDTLPENVTLEKMDDLERQIARDVEAMPQEIQRMEESFNAELEMAEGYGRFVDLGAKDRILHEIREWHRTVADHNCNYGFYRRKMDAYGRAVNEASEALKETYQEKLARLRNSLPLDVRERKEDNILDAIAALIDQRIYSVADDYMRLAENGHTTPPVSYMRAGNSADYFERFIEEFEDLFRKYYDVGRSLYDVYSTYNPERTIHNRLERDAHAFLKTWPLSSSHDNQDEKILGLLRELGFTPTKIGPSSNGRPLSRVVTIAGTDAAADYDHPIAAFGSQLGKQGLTVQVMFGRTDREMIMNVIRSYGSVGNPVMILLDYHLPLPERRAMAATLKREGANTRAVIVIDRILAVFLGKVPKGERIKAMLQCTLPFGCLIPYQASSSSVIPPEMFMGRRDELRSILDPSGTHIIYGGRQLGKTALLYRAKAQIDHHAEGYWAVYINILKKEDSDLPPLICQELVLNGFLDEETEVSDWAALHEAIRRRMMSKSKPVRRLLLLLDEADCFMRSCEGDNYYTIDRLLMLQTNTEDRFKFVLAGLHNVLRYTHKAMDNNSTLMRLVPTCIRPLKYSEGSELLEKPLFYLGFRMEAEHVALISQILSTCNYYPGLIHYYAYQLLNKMGLNPVRGDAPPYYLDEAQIRNLLQDPSFTEQIKEKLFITLGVDASEGSHYRILAYALAYCFHDDREGASFGFTASELMHVCGQFNISAIVNLGEHTVHSLLEEMVELNVLRMSMDKTLFSFNRRSFLEMLGDAATVWAELEGFGDDAAR